MNVINRRELRERKGIRYSPEHLRRLWEAGRFPRPFKLSSGGLLFWSEEEIDKYLDACAGNRVSNEQAKQEQHTAG
jgi:predicted DNA-binding transcriptional regulator AlpA